MAMSAGSVSGGNDGKTDSGRGSVPMQNITKANRKTGKIPGSMSKMSNDRMMVRRAGK